MDTITVRTAQNIDIDYEIGGIGERILAYILDILIFVALAIIGSLSSLYSSKHVIQVYFIVCGILLLFYDLFCEVFFNGQSMGKHVLKIRVISLEGGRPKFSQYLLRWLFRLVDFPLTSYLAGTITIIMTDDSQRIGDVVAGTIVVKTQARTRMNALPFRTVDEHYEPVFIQAARLKDGEVNLIYEVMENYFKTGNSTIVYTMADKVRQHLTVNLPPDMNSMQFLQTVVKDYNFYCSTAIV